MLKLFFLLQEYRAVLEIKLKSLDNQEQSFKICLIGEGVIPRIRLVYPAPKHHKMSFLHFPVTCLGSVPVKQIRFKGVSSVKALVTVKVLHQKKDDRPVFWLRSAPNTSSMVTYGSNGKYFNSVMINTLIYRF